MSEAMHAEELKTTLTADPISTAEALKLLTRLASLFKGAGLVEAQLDATLTSKQAAEWLQCSVKTLNTLARKNKIPAIEFGNEFRFHPRTLIEAGHERYFRAHPKK